MNTIWRAFNLQPLLPLRPGRPERRTHDYYRHGTSSLIAALTVRTGVVIRACHRRHRHQEFIRFRGAIDEAVKATGPDGTAVHIVRDSYATHWTPAVQRWPGRRPEHHLPFTPTSASWLNQVERVFADLTQKQRRRGVFTSVAAPERAAIACIDARNENARPFAWTADASTILGRVARNRATIPKSGHYPWGWWGRRGSGLPGRRRQGGPTVTDSNPNDPHPSRVLRRSLVRKGAKFDFEVVTIDAGNGHTLEREIVRHPGAVVVLPILEAAGQPPRVVLIRNDRVSVERRLWELPAGTRESGEDPGRTAARELEEETGYSAATLEPLGRFYTSPGLSDERMWAFVARGLTPVGQRLGPDERLSVHPTPVSAVLRMIDRAGEVGEDDGRIEDGKSMVVLLWAARRGLLTLRPTSDRTGGP
ncbi:MAG: NUDIX domain-containing protein [Phycisphaerae bacterium]|nr:NUDIX domain-containing protein [Phycisphaerae bacterium]